MDATAKARLLRKGRHLEEATLGWNIIGVVVLGFAAISARSVALAGFGLDSLIEIGASTVVIWELNGADESRQRRAMRLIALAFALLSVYLVIQGTIAIVTRHRPSPSASGIVWTAMTALAMFTLAEGKKRTGRALANRVLETEGRVTLIDGILAVAILVGLVLNATLRWWWSDPVAGFILVYYAVRECVTIYGHESSL